MEVYANLTETVQATAPTTCERRKCGALIQTGEGRFYIRDKNKLDKAGKYVCKKCILHYKNDAETIMRQPSAGSTGMRQPSSESIRQPPSPDSMRQQLSSEKQRPTMSNQEVKNISRAVNESQRQGGHTPRGRVTPLPPTFSSQAGPGPSISNPQFVYGSLINGQFVPQQAPHVVSQGSSTSRPIVGYSSAHAQHAQQTQKWSQLAYRGSVGGSSPNIINANLEVYQPDMDKKGDPIRIVGIRESMSVPVEISHRELYNVIKEELQQSFVNYLTENQVTVSNDILNTMTARETTKGLWARVDQNNSSSYFGSRFITPPKKKSDIVPTFKAPPKPLVFGWVIPTQVWTQVCENQDIQYMNSHMPPPSLQSNQHSKLNTKRSNAVSSKRTRKGATTTHMEASEHEFRNTLTSDEDEFLPESIVKKPRLERMLKRSTTAKTQVSENALESPSANDSEDEDSQLNIGTAKRPIELGSDSESSTSKAHASQTRQSMAPLAPANIPKTSASNKRFSGTTFVPLKVDSISRAFQQGGTSTKTASDNGKDGQLLSESILFFPLPEYTFHELIEDPNKVTNSIVSIHPDENLHFHAHLVYNPDPKMRLGKGTFKTAISARLEFDGTRKPTTGLGSVGPSSIAVALKRPFITTPVAEPSSNVQLGGPAKLKRKELRLSYIEEHQAILGEARLLVWANALLKYSYDFIFNFIDNANISKASHPEFIIHMPVFRFVHAGMAIATKNVDSVGGSKVPSSSRASYLLEEMLPGNKIDFVKYINNSRAVSLLEPGEPDYRLAEFLTFIQHVQLQITHKMAYISDFQGVDTMLTDPQIMTCPKLGSSLFGEGNLGNAFERFPNEHVCNHYCEWFQLKALRE